MTREEAIKALRLEGGIEINGNAVRVAEFLQGLDVALATLRPISREQVEKVWKGEWKHTHSSDNFWTEVWVCSRCGLEDDNGNCFDFCPSCGAPMTDEAVKMVMDRLEALKDDY